MPVKTILVIEDDHDTRVSLRQNLETAGYFVFSATNGVTGLETLKRIKAPNLILLDAVMPLMNGEEFIGAVKSHPDLKEIPIVVASAFPDLAKSLSALAYIQKPINLKLLLDTVEEHSKQ